MSSRFAASPFIASIRVESCPACENFATLFRACQMTTPPPVMEKKSPTPWRRRSAWMLRNAHDRIRRPQALNKAGKTPFEVIDTHDIVQLRYYPPAVGHTATKQPVVIVPPLAVNMLIYDLFPDRSLVATLRDAGHPVYLLDWGRPTRQHAHYRFETYLTELMPKLLAKVRQHSGQQILSLHGWSIGSVFAYAYTAMGDKDIDRLVLLGPPCDYHAPGPNAAQNRLIAKQLKRVQKLTGWTIDRSEQTLWHVPGWANSLGFKLMSPGGTLRGYLELAKRLDDRDFVSAHATNAAFLDDMVSYPGGFMRDVLQFLITENVLARGKLPLQQSQATLENIHSKVLIVVGDNDPIITPKASKRLVELMTNAECETLQVPGGHMSIVSGRQAPIDIWPKVVEWLA